MTCETTRQRLLRAERPDRPPADVQPHLAACGACRAWQRRLTRIERQVGDLPVPASAPPPDLLRKLLNGPPPLPAPHSPNGSAPPWWVAATAAGQANGNPPWWVTPSEGERQSPNTVSRRGRPDPASPHHDRGRRKVAVAFALTLGLAVFSLCWGLWSQAPPEATPRHSAFAARQDGFDRRLASARTPKERLGLITDFAGELEREALASARTGDPDKVREVATLYVQIVRFRLPNSANALPREEREAVVREVAERLRQTESQMQHFLTENKAHAGSESLRDIAVAARDMQDRLWAMLRDV